MFVTVRFADDKRELFNPDCRNCSLLSNIKERCDCDDEDVVDLSDESGYLKNLPLHPLDYATKYLKNRETLVLVKGEKDHRNNITFVPLLEGLEMDKAFLDRLNPPPKKDDIRDSPTRPHLAGARGKRASIAARPKQAQLQLPGAAVTRNVSPGRRNSRARSHSVQLSHSPFQTKRS